MHEHGIELIRNALCLTSMRTNSIWATLRYWISINKMHYKYLQNNYAQNCGPFVCRVKQLALARLPLYGAQYGCREVGELARKMHGGFSFRSFSERMGVGRRVTMEGSWITGKCGRGCEKAQRGGH